jgi:outer membrane protein
VQVIILLVSSAAIGFLLMAQGASADTVPMENIEDADTNYVHTSPWFVHVGFIDAIYDSGARIALGGHMLPGATVNVSNNATLGLDLGYDVTRNISIVLSAGFPPKPNITGQGSVAAYGSFGKVRYGAGIVTATYTWHDWGAFQPYVGTGLAYAIIIHPRDGALQDLGVNNNFGLVLQAGAKYAVDNNWSFYVDAKKLWLSVDAKGELIGLPVRASIKLNPVLVTTGVEYHFD